MQKYDAIIIGTGQAGPPLAARLVDAGMKVAVMVWHGSRLRSQRYANYLESNFEGSILNSTDLINRYLDETRALQKDQKP
jgi:choline dehydrogenase-like flavoprotein